MADHGLIVQYATHRTLTRDRTPQRRQKQRKHMALRGRRNGPLRPAPHRTRRGAIAVAASRSAH